MGAKTSVAESVGFVFMIEMVVSSMSVYVHVYNGHSTLGAQEMSACDVW